jgi:general stress protein YciG
MAEIGREGGQSVSGDRAHMAEIGREGGHRRQALRTPATESSANEDKEGHSPPPEHPSYH